MVQTSTSWNRWVFITGLLFLPGAFAQVPAQTAEPVTTCKAPTDPGLVSQSELCAAHAGCALVVRMNTTCTAVQRFYDRLSESVGPGVKTLFGYRKEVREQNVWDAVQTDRSRRLDSDTQARAKTAEVLAGLKNAPTDVLRERGADGIERVYVGNVSGGKLQGYGVRYGSDGEMTRGLWSLGKLNGPADSISVAANGDVARKVGTFVDGRFVSGIMMLADGGRVEGRYDAKTGQLTDGSKFRADGSLLEKGVFRNGQLYLGEKYAGGVVVANVNGPREEMQKAEAEQASNLDRTRRQKEAAAAAEQTSRLALLAADRQFREKLGSMNAGQLYALSDELSAGGDSKKAREVLRTLVARFPDHALTSEAVKQMAALSSAEASAAAAAEQRSSEARERCESSYKSMAAEFKELNAMPSENSVDGLQRVIYATSKSLALGNGVCKGSAHEAELTARMQSSLDAAVKACTQLAVNGTTCSPRASISSFRAEALQNQQRAALARQQEAENARADKERERAEMRDALNQLSDALGKAVQSRSGGAKSDANTCGNGLPRPASGICTAR